MKGGNKRKMRYQIRAKDKSGWFNFSHRKLTSKLAARKMAKDLPSHIKHYRIVKRK